MTTYKTPLVVLDIGLSQDDVKKIVHSISLALPPGYIAKAVRWPDYVLDQGGMKISNDRKNKFYIECAKVL